MAFTRPRISDRDLERLASVAQPLEWTPADYDGLLEEIGDARLVLIGDGPERGRVQQTAEEEGVDDRVLFVGKQESVAEILSCADLFLLPSATESFGLVALEAMSCGVPVVATCVGGIPEVVPHGEAGYLAPVGDVDTMAEQSVHILKDTEGWRRMSANARAAAERYSTQRVIPMYEDYYQQIAGTK